MPLSLFALSLKGGRLRNFVGYDYREGQTEMPPDFLRGQNRKNESSALKNTCRKIRSDLRKLMTDVRGFASLAEVRKGIML